MSFEEIDLQWFAAEDEGRTEDPTEFKIQKAREEGRVAKSQELCSAIVMLSTVIVLIIGAPYYLKWCEQVLFFYFTHCTEPEFLQKRFFFHFLLNLAKMVLPLAIIGIVAGVLANIFQNRGFIFSLKPIQPQFSKITPRIGQYLKKTLFSFEGGWNVAKSFGKVTIVGISAYIIIRINVPFILQSINSADIYHSIGKIAWTAAQILVTCAIVFLVISIPDYLVQKKQFIESMKMTKQEVKREFKENEGDPEVKAHLQAAQRELLQRNMPQQVAKSDVVITNPTHYAVALLYDQFKNDAPEVTAKGTDAVAQRIKNLANENQVPIVENRPLARYIYTECEIGDTIPSDDACFKAVAVIYSHLNKFNNKK